MINFPVEHVKTFDMKDLHKKIGQLIYSEDGDCELQEKGFMVKQLWFVTDNRNMYLIWEERI